MTSVCWVKGVPGRLTRIERFGAYLPVDRWVQTALTGRIRAQEARGSLELSFRDPGASAKKAVTNEKEAKA